MNCELFVLFKLGIVPLNGFVMVCFDNGWGIPQNDPKRPFSSPERNRETPVSKAFSGPLARQRMTMLPLEAATSYACGWTKRW